MDLLSPKRIKELLTKYGAAPLKSLGQNFLINKNVLEKIIKAADLNGGEEILEIGPGLGTLTQELAKNAKEVIAVEKDRKFVEILKETLKEHNNVKIIHADILKISLADIGLTVTKPVSFKGNGYVAAQRDRNGHQDLNRLMPYKVIANLPYNIASAVIRKFLETENPPREMILMVQKEVAQRICACPPLLRSGAGRRAKPDMSLLAVSVQFYAKPKIVSYVSPGCFWPRPKISSAILKILPKKQLPEVLPQDFFRFVKAGFAAPRKQLAGNLSKGLKIERRIIEKLLKETGIEPSRRAETLSVEEWTKIVQCLIPNI